MYLTEWTVISFQRWVTIWWGTGMEWRTLPSQWRTVTSLCRFVLNSGPNTTIFVSASVLTHWHGHLRKPESEEPWLWRSPTPWRTSLVKSGLLCFKRWELIEIVSSTTNQCLGLQHRCWPCCVSCSTGTPHTRLWRGENTVGCFCLDFVTLNSRTPY